MARNVWAASIISCFAPNGHPLEDDSMAHLIRGLEHNSELEILNLSRNKCLRSGIIALANLMDRTKIRHIDLSSQCMNQDETLNLSLLVGALGRTSSLESLELQFNKLSSDNDMVFVAVSLTHNTSIKRIGLANNKVTNSGMEILCTRIKMMSVLESIDLANNSFEEEGGEMLARAMKENLIIRRVGFDRRLRCYKMIQYFADLNWGGRRFVKAKRSKECLGNPTISPSLWPIILGRVKSLAQDPQLSSSRDRQAEVLYFLLREGSAMFPI